MHSGRTALKGLRKAKLAKSHAFVQATNVSSWRVGEGGRYFFPCVVKLLGTRLEPLSRFGCCYWLANQIDFSKSLLQVIDILRRIQDIVYGFYGFIEAVEGGYGCGWILGRV